eukprot:CAMPEP_0119017248 /NCGR_PEP_ID=MMETSP1176-20130426/15916_1 /TAXON_ID=265551 /ORGANISM="Synedropsis recta cf, Strain CCMP1620" /LENGTH=188 /DNA_ID=CAMNT_0006970915 /DNA_START=60 /DNA_END=622 /DNA_ORIENTATION=+
MKTMMRLLFVVLMCLLQAALSQDDACTTESATLNLNEDISSAVSALQTEASGVLQSFTDYCRVFPPSCVANLADLDSHAELTVVCIDQGGQIVARDVGLKCTGKISGIPIPGGFTVETQNFPACVGASCDPNALPSAVEGVFGSVLDGAGAEIENALGDGANCTQTGISGGWSLGMSTTLAILGAVSA